MIPAKCWLQRWENDICWDMFKWPASIAQYSPLPIFDYSRIKFSLYHRTQQRNAPVKHQRWIRQRWVNSYKFCQFICLQTRESDNSYLFCLTEPNNRTLNKITNDGSNNGEWNSYEFYLCIFSKSASQIIRFFLCLTEPNNGPPNKNTNDGSNNGE